MSKKKKIIAIIAILSCVIVSFIGGQSYSKYVSEVRGDAVAEIATWSFLVNHETEQMQTIQLVSTCNDETLVNNKIAPGTSGSFDILIDGTLAEVGINYNVKIINETDKPDNLMFRYNGQEFASITDIESYITGTINANDGDKTRNYTIEWYWPYEFGDSEEEIHGNDIKDTQDAQRIAEYTVTIAVSGTQVEPQ